MSPFSIDNANPNNVNDDCEEAGQAIVKSPQKQGQANDVKQL